MKLDLVCDISGSMGESGKLFTQRTVVTSIAQWVCFGYARAEIILCGWASEARAFHNWSVEDDFPPELLICGGTTNGQALIELLGETPDGNILVLTDGCWNRDEMRILQRWKERLKPDTIRFIAIGADAHPELIGNDVFAAEDLFAALDGWLEGGSS